MQKEILLDLHIQKPGLYQVIARYVSLNGDNMYSNITFTPDAYGGELIEQCVDSFFF